MVTFSDEQIAEMLFWMLVTEDTEAQIIEGYTGKTTDIHLIKGIYNLREYLSDIDTTSRVRFSDRDSGFEKIKYNEWRIFV